MSLFLFRMGGFIAKYKVVIVAAWVFVLIFLGGAAVAMGSSFNDTFSIPGTESQQGQDVIANRFGQTGTNGVVLFTAKSGKVNSSANKSTVGKIAASVDKVHGVSMNDPLTTTGGELSKDDTAVIGGVQFSSQKPSQKTLDSVITAAKPPAGSGVTTSVGGNAYSSVTGGSTSHVGELLGLIIAFGILALTFGSFVAAGMPLVTAIIGVGTTMSGVVLISHFTTISSTSPTLAEMLGLAVAIDYSLFILSRHRRQLADGVPVVESVQRALSTAGSAVVFAGITVMIALSGLSVVNIPILTVMGLAAAAAVVMAVLAALTLLPAIALLLGHLLVPRSRRKKRKKRKKEKNRKKRRGGPDADGDGKAKRRSKRVGLRVRWVRLVTRFPLVTVIVVVVGLGVLALPTLHISLALSDNSKAAPSTPQRQTYDAITREFGVGYNAPLSVTADIITSTDPKKTVQDLADGLKKTKGVGAVPTATPNEGADTALVQVVPEGGQNDPVTSQLVQRIRADAPNLEKKYHVKNLLVAGQTAVNIDVSARLSKALLPFGAVVVGLSLLLLMIVFRSIAVPLKATIGYLLSVGVALGAVVFVFQDGKIPSSLLGGFSAGSIISFLPIFVMGVLFGLAMDYEMFLVSRMREVYANTGDPRHAVESGFRNSAPVVAAAALIMTSVFAAFVPGGTATIKPIAFGLAVGVLTDAFVVRMTLVPAVLTLLGKRAWWLPRRLDRMMPVVDVEGVVMHRMLAHRDWKATHRTAVVHAPRLTAAPWLPPRELTITAARPTGIVVGDAGHARLLGRQLSGRAAHYPEDLFVDELLLPEQQEDVRCRNALIDVGLLGAPPALTVDGLVAERARLLFASRGRRRRFGTRVHDVWPRIAGPSRASGTTRVGELSAAELAALEAAVAVAAGATIVTFVVIADRSSVQSVADIAACAGRLGAIGVTAVVVGDRLDAASTEWLDIVDLTAPRPQHAVTPASGPATDEQRNP